mmetsp:Transcript_21791/g.86515  ORF Transcript_21791/g.86515 Transcript_21791/m.86515 type:complete len:231 (-) Transcript_21791:382-1074(-)
MLEDVGGHVDRQSDDDDERAQLELHLGVRDEDADDRDECGAVREIEDRRRAVAQERLEEGAEPLDDVVLVQAVRPEQFGLKVRREHERHADRVEREHQRRQRDRRRAARRIAAHRRVDLHDRRLRREVAALEVGERRFGHGRVEQEEHRERLAHGPRVVGADVAVVVVEGLPERLPRQREAPFSRAAHERRADPDVVVRDHDARDDQLERERVGLFVVDEAVGRDDVDVE